MLDVGEQLEFFEVFKADSTLKAEVDLVISGQKEIVLVLANLEEQVDFFFCFKFVLFSAGAVSVDELFYFGIVSKCLWAYDVGVQLFL